MNILFHKKKVQVVMLVLSFFVLYQWCFHLPETTTLERSVFSFQQPFFELENYYLWINLFTFTFPFLLSFDKKVAYYKRWKHLLPGLLGVGAFFIIWDVFFTMNHVWGFNERYLSGISLFYLPLGEWLFFFTVPYACTFIYECLKAYIPRTPLVSIIDHIYIGLIVLMTFIVILFWDKVYPASTALLMLIFLLYQFRTTSQEVRARLLLSYLISWIPFMLVNGALTGLFTQEPVVMYNPESFSNCRILSVPMDDSIYSLLLLSMNIVFMEKSIQR